LRRLCVNGDDIYQADTDLRRVADAIPATVRADYLPELFQRKEQWEQSKINLRVMAEAELKQVI
jgi:hypothetical protein